MQFATFVGLAGAVAYLTAYGLLQLRVLSIESGWYVLLNIVGGLALIYSLVWEFNLGSFLTQVAWLVFTVVGFIHGRRRKLAAAGE